MKDADPRPVSRFFRLSRWLVERASLLVPADRRDEWQGAWLGEIWHRALALESEGALRNDRGPRSPASQLRGVLARALPGIARMAARRARQGPAPRIPFASIETGIHRRSAPHARARHRGERVSLQRRGERSPSSLSLPRHRSPRRLRVFVSETLIREGIRRVDGAPGLPRHRRGKPHARLLRRVRSRKPRPRRHRRAAEAPDRGLLGRRIRDSRHDARDRTGFHSRRDGARRAGRDPEPPNLPAALRRRSDPRRSRDPRERRSQNARGSDAPSPSAPRCRPLASDVVSARRGAPALETLLDRSRAHEGRSGARRRTERNRRPGPTPRRGSGGGSAGIRGLSSFR